MTTALDHRVECTNKSSPEGGASMRIKDMKATKALQGRKVPSRAASTRQNSLDSLGEPPKFGFAFDIDGVLLRGGDVIPQALEAMQILNGENAFGIKVPYIFLTNGGGKHEKDRCQELSEKLHVPVSESQFIQSHTPMSQLAEQYKTVLVVGGVGEACREVALSYGFKDPVTPGDIILWDPSITPFRELTEEEKANSIARDFSKVNIEAILVFADSRAWASDEQIILDVLMSDNGRLHTIGTAGTGPPIYFSNPDFVWSTNNKLPRYGMGALRLGIEALYKAHTGYDLSSRLTQFGKPHTATYDFAERVLNSWHSELYAEDDQSPTKPPERVYMVGDNPQSDIRGANDFGWESILVKTGVWDEDINHDAYPAGHIAENVLEAVKYAMVKELPGSLATTPSHINLTKLN